MAIKQVMSPVMAQPPGVEKTPSQPIIKSNPLPPDKSATPKITSITAPSPNNPVKPINTRIEPIQSEPLPVLKQQIGSFEGIKFDWSFGDTGLISVANGDVGISVIVPALFIKRRIYAAIYSVNSASQIIADLLCFRNDSIVGKLPLARQPVNLNVPSSQSVFCNFEQSYNFGLASNGAVGAITGFQVMPVKNQISFNTANSPTLNLPSNAPDYLYPFEIESEFDKLTVSIRQLVAPISNYRVVLFCLSQKK